MRTSRIITRSQKPNLAHSRNPNTKPDPAKPLKLDDLIRQVQEGKLTEEQLVVLQRRLAEDDDVLDSKTAEEETTIEGREEGEVSEERLLAGVLATSLADLIVERDQVYGLRNLARQFGTTETSLRRSLSTKRV